ncbi:hypothetical protein [Rhodohalobacter sp.]|uniref:hypothetical protein n=1 Tax=Rhodohalobacter sp. TaxID=1974210 RepID=UPI002ACDD592|nr:hypothetical protein [Rhodohalobacter sp.]MDZ7758395.1 hypothetical protein [Rhodohalobacter sp.]
MSTFCSLLMTYGVTIFQQNGVWWLLSTHARRVGITQVFDLNTGLETVDFSSTLSYSDLRKQNSNEPTYLRTKLVRNAESA